MSKPPSTHTLTTIDPDLRNDPIRLKAWIIQQALELGFSACGIAAPDTRDQMPYFLANLDDGFFGEMDYLSRNLDKRADPTLLVDGTKSVISVRMDYLTEAAPHRYVPEQPNQAIVARYARGRDYHKVVRARLKQLAQRIEAKIGTCMSRPFTDSAPIFEKTLAQNAGLGWTGKHTLLINKQASSSSAFPPLSTGIGSRYIAEIFVAVMENIVINELVCVKFKMS